MTLLAGLTRNRVARWIFIALLVAAGFAGAQGVQPVPELTSHVIDSSGTLDAIALKGLDDKLLDYEKRKGTQIAVLMVATTQPEDITSYSNRVANTWKIGRKAIGDGVLIVVAKNDRKIRIEVAKSLEGAVPDLAAKNIIDEAITPSFKKGDYAAGLRDGVDQLIARIDGEKLPEPKQSSSARSSGWGVGGFDWMELAIFGFVLVPVVAGVLKSIFGRTLGSLATGTGIGAIALFVTSSLLIACGVAFIALLISIFSGGGRGRSRLGGVPIVFGGGSGGGGFGGGGGSSWGGSGGGGNFGGGGASGDW